MGARPVLHFTADSGWINDPHGLVHVDGRYHLFYQYVPGEPVWTPRLRWGHASSTDLVSWQEHDPAVLPHPPETGCWSGSLVETADGPVIFYTSTTAVSAPAWHVGAVAAARGSADLADWPPTRRQLVLAAPAPDSGVDIFRDPFVRRHGDAWVMLVGSRRDGAGAVLQFSSPDLERWSYDGPLLTAADAGEVPHDLGTMWECPQLIRLDGDWVGLFSIWRDDVLEHVLYAVGDYDGRRFTPRSWGRFDAGPVLYATSVFHDADARPCAISWLREDAASFDPAAARRAGAHSMPVELGLTGDRLVVRFHRNLEARSRRRDSAVLAAGPLVLRMPRPPVRVRCTGLAGDAGLRLSGPSSTVAVDLRPDTLTVRDGTGRLLAEAPRVGGGGDVDLLLDGDLLELITGGVEGLVSCRSGFDDTVPAELTLRGPAGATITVDELSPFPD